LECQKLLWVLLNRIKILLWFLWIARV